MKTPRPTSLVRTAVEALEDLKGIDIRVLDVRKLTTVTDWMIMCTGTSNRHVKSLADSVVQAAKDSGTRPLGAQGMEMGEWVLVDLDSVVVHVMQTQTRAFYQLEKLWDVAPEPEAGAVAKAPKPAKAKPKSKAKKAVRPAARKAPSRAKAATGAKKRR